MAFKDKFANQGLYRLWLILFWGWVFIYFSFDIHLEFKAYYIDTVWSDWCDRELASGKISQFERYSCGLFRDVQDGPHPNILMSFFYMAFGLFAPPYGVYLVGRVVGWVQSGFNNQEKAK